MSEPHNHVSAATEVLDFLNSIEGAGYGGMASFEIARQYVREMIVNGVAQSSPEPVKDDRTLTQVIADIRALVAANGGLMHEISESEAPITDLMYLKQQSEKLSVEDQHALAEFIAPNLGMVLVNEPPHPDCPHERLSAGRESAADTEMYRLRDLIASHIACEADCQKMPTGCGCALTAARAVMNAVPQPAPVTPELIEAGAQAIAPEVWATDVKVFGHPDSLKRRGHELCKSRVRAQAEACLLAALSLTRPERK